MNPKQPFEIEAKFVMELHGISLNGAKIKSLSLEVTILIEKPQEMWS
jgi:hypothetical protein